MRAPGAAVITQAIHGLGGVGKSELALHYAHSRRDRYRLIWWITAENRAQIADGLAALAARLCPPLALVGATDAAAAWALGWLQAHRGWLLILDNINEPEDAAPLIAQLPDGHIIITTRRDPSWPQYGATPLRLGTLDPDAAAAIITAHTGHAGPDDRIAAHAIAAELGYLPLALHQAASYIKQTRLTPAAYLAKLLDNPARMYAVGDGGHPQRTIARLWDITLNRINQLNPDALWLLHILACSAPDNIPRAIVHESAHGSDCDEALALLASYSLITLTPATITIHRLLQAVILAQAPQSKDGQPAACDIALEWMNNIIPGDPQFDVGGWPLLRDLIPHAQALASRYPSVNQPVKLGRMQNEIAVFHQTQGDYERARTLRISVRQIYESALGSDHPDTATVLGNLAATYRRLACPEEALPLDQRALVITEAVLGPDHPDTAIRLNNLAATYWDLGRPAEALPLAQRALNITQTALGPDHPDTAIRLNNLAAIIRDLGWPTEAFPLAQRALVITEAVLGPDHPDTAIRLNNLAATYRDLGRPAEALPLAQRALNITQTALGPDHPDAVFRLNSLAATYRDLGRSPRAMRV